MAASVERSKLCSALPRKGFVERSGTKHDVFRLEVDGRETTVFTKVSRGTNYKVISADGVAKMSKQLHLSKGEFLEMIDCKIDAVEYLRILDRNGVKI